MENGIERRLENFLVELEREGYEVEAGLKDEANFTALYGRHADLFGESALAEAKALPPERGLLSGDPVRFGVSDILSFSPLGTATPGTFYLAGDAGQAAVRVTGGSARVRLMVWRSGRWRER